MKLSQSHINFYREQKTPMPQWAIDWAKKRKYPWSQRVKFTDVNELINWQIEKYDRRLEACNLCHLVKSKRELLSTAVGRSVDPEYPTMQSYLYHLAFQPYSTDSKRRTGYALRWYRKLYCIPWFVVFKRRA